MLLLPHLQQRKFKGAKNKQGRVLEKAYLNLQLRVELSPVETEGSLLGHCSFGAHFAGRNIGTRTRCHLLLFPLEPAIPKQGNR